jgi:hypothetical protein
MNQLLHATQDTAEHQKEKTCSNTLWMCIVMPIVSESLARSISAPELGCVVVAPTVQGIHINCLSAHHTLCWDTQIIMRQPTKQSKYTQNYLQRMCPMGCQARSHTLLSCAFATSACGPSCLFPIQFKSKPLFLTASCPHCSSTKSAQNHNLPYICPFQLTQEKVS